MAAEKLPAIIKAEYFSRQEAAVYMRLSLTTVVTLIRLKELKEYWPSPGSPRLKISEVEKYIQRTAKPK